MKLLRLSKHIINAENISSSGKVNVSGDDFDLAVLFTGAPQDVFFEGEDARALHAWLEANSVAIGEDGAEVLPSSELDGGKLSILNALAIKEPARMGDFCNATDDEQCEALTQLTHDGYIERVNLEGSRIGTYTLTDIGRAAIKGR